MRSPPSLPAVLLLSACGGQGGATFTVRLEPITAPNQTDVFANVASLRVEVRPPGAEPERYDLGAPASGTTPEVGELPAIEEGSVLAVEGYDVESDPPTRLVLYGVTAPLDVGPGEDVVVPVYTAGTERVATFYEMDDGAWCTAGASDGAGNYLLFGGSPVGMLGGTALDGVRRLALAPVSAGFPIETVATLPATSDDWGSDGISSITGRSCASATLLRGSGHDDVGKILVTGGWAAYLNGWSITAQALLYDPVAATFEQVGDLLTPRADHDAVALDSGDVVIFGGFGHTDLETSATFTTTVEVYQPATRSFAYGSDAFAMEVVWGASASLGEEAIWCGGLDYGSSTYGAYNLCYRVDRFGNVMQASAPDLGTDTGILRPAMASLGTGRVLLCGGSLVEGRVKQGDEQAATDRAWVYDAGSDTWTGVASMRQPRAFHAAAALPGERVLVVGGFDASSEAGMGVGDGVACAEVFDYGLNSWSYAGDCATDGSTGVLPAGFGDSAVAVDPEYGVLTFSGLTGSTGGSPHFVLYTPNPRSGE